MEKPVINGPAVLRKQSAKKLFLAFAAALCLAACKSPPPEIPEIPEVPEELPELMPAITFQGIKADDPSRAFLDFLLEIKNPFPRAGRVTIVSWYVTLNEERRGSGFALDCGETDTFPLKASLPEGGPAGETIPLKLTMDIAALAALGLAPRDDYGITLVTALEFSFEGGHTAALEVSGRAAFPGVREPEFTITSIAVLKAELVNTRFRVGLKIANPNPYPVELSAFGYELYGNGRFWSDGLEKNIIKVPGKSFVTGDLFLIMNFINMKRDILDQVINLEDVRYRFRGEARVVTGVEYLPEFKTAFDLSGYSPVYEK